MKKTILLIMATTVALPTLYSQSFFDHVNAELGFAAILHQNGSGKKNNFRVSPNIGINYQNTLHNQWNYEIGLHYINKSFYNMDQSSHFFSRDGQLVEQIVQRIQKVGLHNLAMPVKIGYTFSNIRLQPTIQAGIIPQYSFGGNYYSEINLLMNRELVGKQTKEYSIKDKNNIHHNKSIYNTQYMAGIELHLNTRWQISAQYIFNNNTISLMEIPENPMIDIIEGVSYRDNQLRVSIKYSISD